MRSYVCERWDETTWFIILQWRENAAAELFFSIIVSGGVLHSEAGVSKARVSHRSRARNKIPALIRHELLCFICPLVRRVLRGMLLRLQMSRNGSSEKINENWNIDSPPRSPWHGRMLFDSEWNITNRISWLAAVRSSKCQLTLLWRAAEYY